MKRIFILTALLATVIGSAMLGSCTQKKTVRLCIPVKDESSGKWGYADSTGNKVIPYIYEEAGDFLDGLSRVKLDGKYGFINHAGEEAISCIYEEAEHFGDRLSKVRLNGKYGFIDTAGQEMIPLIYDEMEKGEDGLLSVGANGKYGCIDKNGKIVIPLIYDTTVRFLNGEAKVLQDGKCYFIDRKGEKLPDLMRLEFTYTKTGQSVNGMPVAKLSGYAFFDKATGEKLKYKKLVIDGRTVAHARCYSEPGMTGSNVVEFSFDGGRFIQYSGNVTLAYKIENEILTVLK